LVTEVKIEDENPPEDNEAEHKLSDDFFRAMKEDEFYIKNENVEDCYELLVTTLISISGRFIQGLHSRFKKKR
jgi:hypothetical protein